MSIAPIGSNEVILTAAIDSALAIVRTDLDSHADSHEWAFKINKAPHHTQSLTYNNGTMTFFLISIGSMKLFLSVNTETGVVNQKFTWNNG